MADIHANGRMSAKITVGTVQLYSDGIDPNLVYTKEEVDEKIENIELTPGPKGEKGDKGDKGEDGYTPIKGVDYFDGEQGPIGPQGIQGEKGEPGENGKDGEQGPKGEKGDKGDTGEPGTTDYNELENKPDLTGYATKEELNEVKQSVSDGKTLIASAITDKGVNTSNTDSFQVMANNISNIPLEGGDPYYEELYNLRTKNGTVMTGLFAYSEGDNLDLKKLNVSNVTNMNRMFSSCYVKNIDITGWDTSKVELMERMFEFCSAKIDLNNLNLENVTDVRSMFYQSNLDNLVGLENIKFPKAKNLTSILDGGKKTGVLDLSNWDVSNVTNMSNLLNSTSIKEINLSNWNTSNVTNMGSIFSFSYNSTTEKLYIPDWDMTNTTSYSSMFGYSNVYINNLKYIDLSRSNDITLRKILERLHAKTEATYGDIVVPDNTSQEIIDAFITKYWRPVGPILEFTNLEIISELDEIVGLNKKTKLYLDGSPWYATKEDVEFISSNESIAYINENNEVVSVSYGSVDIYARMKSNNNIVSSPITINVSETDSYPNVIKFRAATTKPETNNYIKINGNNVKLTDMDYNSRLDIYTYDVGEPITSIRFNGYSTTSSSYANNIRELVKLNTSNITDMSYMFQYCMYLENLDITGWDTSNVTNMSYMFQYCFQYSDLSSDLTNLDTSNVTNMSNMFQYCTALTSLDFILGWNTGKVEHMEHMFTGCKSLTSIDLSNLNTASLISMTDMFYLCSSLISANLSGWNTTGVKEFAGLFSGCSSLTSINLSSFDTSNSTYSINMLYNVPSNIDFNYDGTNYQNWTLTESETSFSGTFPWNEEKEGE